jgi:DNA-binding transcriptional ArsR family regulator
MTTETTAPATETSPARLLDRLGSSVRLVAAFGSPWRVRILAVIAEIGETSPREIAAELDGPLGTVAYHVRVMARAGLLELRAEERVRGAVRHVYGLAPAGVEAVTFLETFAG